LLEFQGDAKKLSIGLQLSRPQVPRLRPYKFGLEAAAWPRGLCHWMLLSVRV